jgi:tetratricopeptide (TPR) repeat protein
MRRLAHPGSRLKAMVCATIFAATSALANDVVCEYQLGRQVVCHPKFEITPEQYKADLNKRAEEIRAEEAEKRAELQKLMESNEGATSPEKIAAVETEGRLEAEGKAVAERLTNLQASYDALVQKLVEVNTGLEAFAPLISKGAFEQAQAMLSRGDVLGAERKFVEIATTVAKIREHADELEARAIFHAGELAEQRIDWRAAYAYYARAKELQPRNWLYANSVGKLAYNMGDYPLAAEFQKAALTLATAEFGSDAPQTATALSNLALVYESLARHTEAEQLYRQAIKINEKTLHKDHPELAILEALNRSAVEIREKYEQGQYAEAVQLYRVAAAAGNSEASDALYRLAIGDRAASRVFAGPHQYPPKDFPAYGIMAFRTRATPDDRSRYLMLCEAFLAVLPHESELALGPSQQMVTVWPIETDYIAAILNLGPRNLTCPTAVDNYNLALAIEAINDAGQAGVGVTGRGPFLLAWSPSTEKGKRDALVLVADLSSVTTNDEAKLRLLRWRTDILLEPNIWKNGWDVESLRVRLREWADEFGPQILSVFGGKK